MSTKDKIDEMNKSGIYEITCSDCSLKYYGQTRRGIETRLKEHKGYIKNNQPRKSAIANHILFNDHQMVSNDNIQLVKEVPNVNKLDAYESYFIHIDDKAINLDNGNITSQLFRLVWNMVAVVVFHCIPIGGCCCFALWFVSLFLLPECSMGQSPHTILQTQNMICWLDEYWIADVNRLLLNDKCLIVCDNNFEIIIATLSFILLYTFSRVRWWCS